MITYVNYEHRRTIVKRRSASAPTRIWRTRPEDLMARILVIDLGTTYFKISLFDRDGRLCDSCRIAPAVAGGESGRAELPIDAFRTAVAQGIAELRDRAGGLADVEAVTFATQTNSFVLLEADNRPLTPIILWPDSRAADLEAEVQKRCAIPEFTATTGIPQVGAQFMVAKLLWLQRRAAETWSQTSHVALISDYSTLLFTGQHVTEAGAAGLTGLLDIHRCCWWPELLARFELEPSRLARVVRAGTDLGPLDPRAARQFGLPETCRFVVGCLDQYAGAIGAGNIGPGMVSETTGTVLATVQCADQFAAQLGPTVFQGPAHREGLYWRMAFGSVSANYLQWYRDQLPDRPEFDQLTALAEKSEPGADGLRLRTAAGLTVPAEVFAGMTPHHTRGHAVRCILEAVAEALRGQMAALSDGPPPAEIRCAGGAARSQLWLQIKADVLGVATVATQCPEPTSLGAAILAEAVLSGRDVPEIARQWVRLKPPHHPDPQRQRQYQAIRSAFAKSS
jgi:xylulokinase